MIIAGTGHRPTYLPCQYDETHTWCVKLKEELRQMLSLNKPSLVISGMALGFDTYLAEAAIELNIPIDAYIPFKGQHNTWKEKAQYRYKSILRKANNIKFFGETYNNAYYLIRDRAMIDNCDKVFALWNPEITKGGTFYTVNYAKNLEKEIINFWKN